MYPLYLRKKLKINIKDLEESILENRLFLEEANNKLKNNEFILKKKKLKFEIGKRERDEKNNMLKIEELIEISDLNNKILSL